MLPANLAKTRTAGRGTYGELVVLSGTPSSSLGAVGTTTATTVRYAPYPLPATITAASAGQQSATTHILPITTNTPSIIQYASPTTHTLYDAAAAMTYKRLLAATAAASLRPNPHHPGHPTARATTTLTYPIADLLGIQGLDLSGLYQIPTIGL